MNQGVRFSSLLLLSSLAIIMIGVGRNVFTSQLQSSQPSIIHIGESIEIQNPWKTSSDPSPPPPRPVLFTVTAVKMPSDIEFNHLRIDQGYTSMIAYMSIKNLDVRGMFMSFDVEVKTDNGYYYEPILYSGAWSEWVHPGQTLNTWNIYEIQEGLEPTEIIVQSYDGKILFIVKLKLDLLSKESNIVSLRLKTDKLFSPYGEVVQINVVIKNVGEKNITLGGLSIGYVVYDSSKREVHSLGVDVTLVPITIPPQEEFEIRDLLRWNISNVAPGTYTIEVIVSGPFGKAVAEVEVII